jgi:hypothetical protein
MVTAEHKQRHHATVHFSLALAPLGRYSAKSPEFNASSNEFRISWISSCFLKITEHLHDIPVQAEAPKFEKAPFLFENNYRSLKISNLIPYFPAGISPESKKKAKCKMQLPLLHRQSSECCGEISLLAQLGTSGHAFKEP